MKYTTEELLDEIRRLNKELGHPPTLQELREHSDYSATTYYNRFGSWRDALDAAGFSPREPERRIETSTLLDELQELGEKYEVSPTVNLMNEQGEYSASVYKRRFGSWNEALEAAGFDPNVFDSKIAAADLVAALRDLATETDSPPTFEEMKDKGKYSPSTYVRRFGSWNNALRYAGVEANTEKGISKDELRSELTRVADVIDKQPSAQEMAEIGEYAVATYQRRFGSWSEALNAVFENLSSNARADGDDEAE